MKWNQAAGTISYTMSSMKSFYVNDDTYFLIDLRNKFDDSPCNEVQNIIEKYDFEQD